MPGISVLMPMKIDDEQSLKWAIEAIESVKAQTYADWELVIVDDRSTADLGPLRAVCGDGRIRGARNKGEGVSAARNTAAERATADLILPLDADDTLPQNSLERFMFAWEHGGKDAGIVYSDVSMFGTDYQRYYTPPTYNFNTLLQNTIMVAGCLHKKSDWSRSGGWKTEMNDGLEDWEYWITLGELGVCGFVHHEALYKYRRHAGGRLAALRADPDKWTAAITRLRDIHKDTYNGRRPAMCCGGASSAPKGARVGVRQASVPSDGPLTNPVTIAYIGKRKGGFGVRGPATGRIYRIGGTGTTFPAEHADMVGLRRINRGKDFAEA